MTFTYKILGNVPQYLNKLLFCNMIYTIWQPEKFFINVFGYQVWSIVRYHNDIYDEKCFKIIFMYLECSAEYYWKPTRQSLSKDDIVKTIEWVKGNKMF